MARKRFHGLQKVKLRATWSKYNLYNLTRMKLPPVAHQTYFQQKWSAKAATRAYHGEHVREGQWARMFTTRLNSVIPMNARYLAEHDGSEQAAGRGSGKETAPTNERVKGSMSTQKRVPVPYMHMTYAPLERRLDMAIWRSLFASSARQARQMVIHGQVRVNGQKMPYPGYLLNPGDMFQVEPDRVLFATGDTKDPSQAKEGRRIRKVRRHENIVRDERRAQFRAKREANKAAKAVEASEDLTIREKTVRARIPRTEEEQRKETRKQYQILLKDVKKYLAEKTGAGAKTKQALRAYMKDIKNAMGSLTNKKTDIKGIESTFFALAARLPQVITDNKLLPKGLVSKQSKKSDADQESTPEAKLAELSVEDQQAIKEAMVRIRENPVDDSKPYATPWRPRPYMSAFAFIPRYLEVNQNICSAVYLRHPVARPGLAEVPTPFGQETQQLAFNWYLKRR